MTHVFGASVGGQKIYVDGQLRASGTKQQSDFGWQNGINIGFSYDAATDYFEGEIAEVSLWSVARSERDILAWKERVVGNESGLQALWSFSERRGDLVRDITGKGKQAKIHGTPGWALTDDFPGEFLVNIVPGDIEDIRSEGEQLAKVGSSLGKGYDENPPEQLPTRPLSELISAGQLPQFDLMKRLLAAVQNNELTLNQALLSEFGSIGNFAAEVLDVFVTIRNPKIEFATGKPGMTGAPGMETVTDAEGNTKLATPEDHALKVSGDVTLFNTIGFSLQYADFFHYKGEPKCSFKFIGAQPLGIGTFLPGVPLLQALKLSGPTFIVCNASTLYDPTLDSGINEGFYFFGIL